MIESSEDCGFDNPEWDCLLVLKALGQRDIITLTPVQGHQGCQDNETGKFDKQEERNPNSLDQNHYVAYLKTASKITFSLKL